MEQAGNWIASLDDLLMCSPPTQTLRFPFHASEILLYMPNTNTVEVFAS